MQSKGKKADKTIKPKKQGCSIWVSKETKMMINRYKILIGAKSADDVLVRVFNALQEKTTIK